MTNNDLEKNLVEVLGLNKDALVAGSLEMNFEGGVPHLVMKMNFVVPPKLMSEAFAAVAPPEPEAPPAPPVAPTPPPFPVAPDAGAEGAEEAGPEGVHDITTLPQDEPVPAP